MLKAVEKIYYVLYKLARKGNNEYDSSCIAALLLFILIMLLFMNIDILIEIVTGHCFILRSDTKLNVIVFSGLIIILLFSLFVFTGMFKRIEAKYKDSSEAEFRQMNKLTIICYSTAFTLFIIGVIVYNTLK